MKATFPQRAFKFTKSEFLQGTLQEGIVKIGTAREMRIADSVDAGRSDPFELGHRLDFPRVIAFSDNMSPEEEARSMLILSRTGAIQGPLETAPTFRNLAFRLPDEERSINLNGYIYSLVRNVNGSVARRMKEDFGYDVCLEVSDTYSLFSALTARLGAQRGGCGPVQYVDFYRDITDPEWSTVNPYIKDERYSWQDELRFCWPCAEDLIMGPVIQAPEVKHLFRVVHPFEFGGLS